MLQEVFGYPAFRGLQEDVVAQVSTGGDALVLMPTGAGKSLCYQVPAIVRHRAGQGVTLVVSPLIALMQDQVGALEEVGVHAAFLNSSLDFERAQKVERELLSGRLTLLYAAPERLTTPRFLAMLESLHERGQLSLFAIDEAHCVSQWGHDFREDYLQLSLLHERFPDVPRVALTATADEHTRADIVDRLQLHDAKVFISSFDRPNIRYTIVEKDNPRQQLLRFVRDEHEGEAGIVYCGSRKKVEETAAWLSGEGVPALPYHAGLDVELRRTHQDRFLRDEGLVMVATVAFGMGIDKPDVRFVAHLDLPKNIEGYYQETGRAGRDGQPADAWMTYGLQDVVNQRRMIDESPAGDEFKRIQRGKLDALLALAETHTCRRERLLEYFGERCSSPVPENNPAPSSGVLSRVLDRMAGRSVVDDEGPRYRCGNCDNCLSPPAVWDATDAARKLLSCIYRFAQHGREQGMARGFGAGHLIDVLRGKTTDKVEQYGHQQLSTFGVGADLTESQWRAVLRQMIALGHVVSEGEFNTLGLADSARSVLKGDVAVQMRRPSDPAPRGRRGSRTRGESGSRRSATPVVPDLSPHQQQRYDDLRAWRAEVARGHNLPAYVVFHDATLAEMARQQPVTLTDLATISGVGSKKLEAYGLEILRVLNDDE